MAATGITGLDIDESLVTTADLNVGDLSPIEKKILDGFNALGRGTPKAAAAHLVDAVNMLASEYGLNCGASL